MARCETRKTAVVMNKALISGFHIKDLSLIDQFISSLPSHEFDNLVSISLLYMS